MVFLMMYSPTLFLSYYVRTMVKRVSSGSGLVKDAIKFGFGFSLGSAFVSILFMLFALALFIPGVYLLADERKKNDADKSQAKLVSAYILIGLGCVLGFGLGGSFLFENLMTDF